MANWFSQGLAEFRREFDRHQTRLRIRRIRKELRPAEISLGELGWQQADYGPQLIGVIDQLNRAEHDEVDLLNQSADFARRLEALRAEQLSANQQMESALAEIREASEALSEQSERVHPELAAAAKTVEQSQAHRRKLEKDLTEANQELFRLMNQAPGPDFLKKRLALVERRNAAQLSLEATETDRLAAERKLRELEKALSEIDAKKETCNERERAVRAEFAFLNEKRRKEIETLESEKRRLEKGATMIERTKADCFALVGRALADAGIAPINQPEALGKVLAIRERLASEEQRLVHSEEASAALPSGDILTFHLVFWSVLALLIAMLVFLIRG